MKSYILLDNFEGKSKKKENRTVKINEIGGH